MNVHLIDSKVTIREALQQMNNNKVKFLVAIDCMRKVKGTLTDGDIRRALLNNHDIEEIISVAMCKNFTVVRIDEQLQAVIEKFKNRSIEFLPVVNGDGEIVNLITRRGLNVLLLKNKEFHMDFDFSQIDENDLEHEIFARPWGFYKTTILNDFFQSKVIYVMPGQALSLQSHQRREEYWTVVYGEGTIQIGESIHPVIPGQNFFIPKGCKHRLTNTSEKNTLILTEVQLGDYFGEDDIVRYDDMYKRI